MRTGISGCVWSASRNLERAPRRFFRAVAKDQRHSVAGRQPDELLVGRLAHLRRREHDLSELVQPLLLLLDQELGVTDDVDEQDVSNLELRIDRFASLRTHSLAAVFGITPTPTMSMNRTCPISRCRLSSDSGTRFIYRTRSYAAIFF